MAFALRAAASVRRTLKRLHDDPTAADAWQAVSDRITLIRTDPSAPLARGVERQMQPSGVLARATVVPIIGADAAWIIVWRLAEDDAPDVIELVHMEVWQEK